MGGSIAGNSKKLLTALCLTLCLLSLFISGAAWAAEPIKIGILTCLTGPAGFMGQSIEEAFTAVLDEINQKGGVLGRRIEFLIEDDKSNPSNAVIAATKLIRDQKVSLIIGASLADSNAAVLPTIEREHVPMLVASPLVAPFNKDAFLMGPGDARGAAHIIEFVVKKLGAKKIALLRDAAVYGSEGSNYYRQEIKKYPGASIIIEEKMEMTDTNVIPQLTKIKAVKPDVLIIHSLIPAPVAESYRQSGMTVPVYGSHLMPTREFLKLAGSVAEENKWIMTGPKLMIAEKLPANDPFRTTVYDPFKKLLKGKYGPSKDINAFHAVSYDASMVAFEAFRIAGTDSPAGLRDAIEKVRYEGFTGRFACTPTDHQGSPNDIMPEMMVKGGEYVPYAE